MKGGLEPLGRSQAENRELPLHPVSPTAPPKPPTHRGSRTPGSHQPSQGLSGAGAGKAVAPEALTGLCSGCGCCSGLMPSALSSSSPGAGRRSARGLETRVSWESHRPLPSPGPSLLRGCLRTMPGPLSLPSPCPSPAPSSPAWCPLFQEAHLEHHPLWVGGALGGSRGWGRDLDPRLWIPNLPLSKPRTPGFSLALPQFPALERGSGLELRGLSD